MKIQDIFKLNLNDRGGVKLFNKIMGRYNISKADSKELINEVQNSSSGDGGVKEYYYKTDENAKEEVMSLLLEVFSSCNINVLLKKPFDEVIFETSLTMCIASVEDATEQYIGYIKLDGRLCTLVTLGDYDSLNPIGVFEGNIIDRLNKIGMPEYSNYFQEITKEEYESMITYKP